MSYRQLFTKREKDVFYTVSHDDHERASRELLDSHVDVFREECDTREYCDLKELLCHDDPRGGTSTTIPLIPAAAAFISCRIPIPVLPFSLLSEDRRQQHHADAERENEFCLLFGLENFRQVLLLLPFSSLFSEGPKDSSSCSKVREITTPARIIIMLCSIRRESFGSFSCFSLFLIWCIFYCILDFKAFRHVFGRKRGE